LQLRIMRTVLFGESAFYEDKFDRYYPIRKEHTKLMMYTKA